MYVSIIAFILVEASELHKNAVVLTELGQYEVPATKFGLNSVIAISILVGIMEMVGATELNPNSDVAT